MSKRMTKGEFQESLGAFNPVGHSVLAFADDKAAGEAAKAAARRRLRPPRTSSSTPRASSSPT